MRRLPALILTAGILTSMVSPAAEPPLRCLSARPRVPSTLAARVEVGVETIHRDPERIITVFAPIPGTGSPGTVLDINDNRAMQYRLPDRFIISDGTVERSFIGVDQTPGTRLDRCAREIAGRARVAGAQRGEDAIYQYLAAHLIEYLKPVEEMSPLSWDAGLGTPDSARALFESARNWPVGRYPVPVGLSQPVVPLESYLAIGRSYCIQKAILASLILSRLNLPHRVVFGGTSESGHTWIELRDGRILDPTWQLVGIPARDVGAGGWFKYTRTPVFEDTVYPYLSL